MICPKCGKETPDDSQRCVNCGVKFIRKPRQDISGKPPTPPADDAGKTQISSGDDKSIPQPPQGDADKTGISIGGGEKKDDASSGAETPAYSEEEKLREALADRYEIIKKLGNRRLSHEPITQYQKDLAASAQQHLENVLIDLVT